MNESAQRLLDVSSRITALFEDRKRGEPRQAQAVKIKETLEELNEVSRGLRTDAKAELVEKIGEHLLRSLREEDHVDETLAEEFSDAVDEYRVHAGG